MGGSSSSTQKVTPGGKHPDANRHGEEVFPTRYILGEQLGSGAFGEVLECFSLVDESPHAVKLIKKSLLTYDDKMSLENEVSILKDMDHDHIIKLKAHIDDPDMVYIVTDIVRGGELFDRIVRKEKYSEKDARGLVKILLQTMVYIHEKNVVHRDLKPENLLLTSMHDDMDIKICDFGLAKRLQNMSASGKEIACGTPGYVAPEILAGRPYGCEVDIWSVGVITYILVCGYPPFYDDDQKKLFKRIKMAKYDFHDQHWSDKSDNVKDMIKNMICKDQKKRWTAKQLLEHPWMKVDDATLEGNSLSGSQVTMRKFNARRRFKAAAQAIIMTNRIRALTGAILRQYDAESNEYRVGVDAVIKEDAAAAENSELSVEDGVNADLAKLLNS